MPSAPVLAGPGPDRGSGSAPRFATGITPAGTGCRRPCKQHGAHRRAAREICPASARWHWPAGPEVRWPHRDRHGSGAGRPPRLRPPSRCPERNRGHRCHKDNGQRDVRRHHVLHHALPRYGLRSPQSALSSGPVHPACTTPWTAMTGGVGLTDELAPARMPGGGQAVPQGLMSAPGPRCPPTEPGWAGTIRSAVHGPAPWPGPRLGPAGRSADPPSRRAYAGSSACRRGCASSPGQRPSREAGHGRSGLPWQALRCRTEANKAPAQTALVPGW